MDDSQGDAITDETLETVLEHYALDCQNRYFDGASLFLELTFPTNVRGGAEFVPALNRIQIQKSLTVFPNLCRILILHELIHSEVQKKYGREQTEHDAVFQAEVKRLFEAGAYKNLL